MTHESIYMMPFERDVLDLLKAEPGRYIPGDEIAKALESQPRAVRAAVKVLVELHGEPIATRAGCNGGFCYTTDYGEIRLAAGRLIRQLTSIARKIRAMGAPIIVEKTGRQLRIEMEDCDEI